MVVFDSNGKFVQSWGKQFRGGAHGLFASVQGAVAVDPVGGGLDVGHGQAAGRAALPRSPVDLEQPLVDRDGGAAGRSDRLGRLTGPHQRAGQDRRDRLAGQRGGQEGGLPAALLGELRVGPAEHEPVAVGGRLAVPGEDDHRASADEDGAAVLAPG